MSFELKFTIDQLANIQATFGYVQLEEIWGKETRAYSDMGYKFTCCNQNILRFYRALDKGNQKKLLDYICWVLDTHKE